METLIVQLDKEIAETRSKLAALEAARKALGGQSAASTAKPTTRPSGENRAPAGALRNVTLAVLKGHMSPRELRDAAKATGYRYSIDPTQQSKLLSQLMEEKVVKRDGDGKYVKV